MKHITYATEKRIKKIKRIDPCNRTLMQSVVVTVWDNIFKGCSYYGGTLKELENYLGYKLDNRRQESISKHFETKGIHGLNCMTNNNAYYCGTHDLHHINIQDFNKLVKQANNGL